MFFNRFFQIIALGVFFFFNSFSLTAQTSLPKATNPNNNIYSLNTTMFSLSEDYKLEILSNSSFQMNISAIDTNNFTIKYNTNGGSSISDIVMNKNNTAITLPAPSKSEFIFSGWFLDSLFKTKIIVANTISKTIQLYTKWTAESLTRLPYGITNDLRTKLNANGASMINANTYTSEGNIASLKNGSLESGDASFHAIATNTSENYGFEIPFSEEVQLDSIGIGTRPDCCANRSRNITIIIYDSLNNPTGIFNTNDIVGEEPVLQGVYKIKSTGIGGVKAKKIVCQVMGSTTTTEGDYIINISEIVVRGRLLAPDNTLVFITFNSNGDNNGFIQNIKPGSTAIKPANPGKADSTFENWYSNAALTTPFNFNTAITTNTTLYAKWLYDSTTTIPYIKITTLSEIKKEPKVGGTMTIYRSKNNMTEASKIVTSAIAIKYRGKSSFRLSDKKSYNLNLKVTDTGATTKKLSLFGFPSESDWVLITDNFSPSARFGLDPTFMYNAFAYNVWRDMGYYGSRTKFVEVEIDADYKGIYMFAEKIKRGTGRVNIKAISDTNLTGGYLLSIDKTDMDETVEAQMSWDYLHSNWSDDYKFYDTMAFRSQYNSSGYTYDYDPFLNLDGQKQETYYQYIYPKAENITTPQKNYIKNYMYQVENAIKHDTNMTNYIDMNSYADFFIMQELCKSQDAYRLSAYMNKDINGKMKMGPVWDFNVGYSTSSYPNDAWAIKYNDWNQYDVNLVPYTWLALFENAAFRSFVKTKWNAYKTTLINLPNLSTFIDKQGSNLKNSGAVERNYNRWTGLFQASEYDSKIQSFKDWLQNRIAWLDNQISTW